MKKIDIVLSTLILFTLLFGGVQLASAKEITIGHEFEIEGVGLVDIDLEVQTENLFDGLKLSDSLYTPSGGYRGASELRYVSVLELGMYNDGENETSDMEYTQVVEIANGKGSFASKNYLIGAGNGFKYEGDVSQEVSTYSDNTLSESLVCGSVDGELTLTQNVVDPDTKILIVKDISSVKGEFHYNYSTYVEVPDYPESLNGDWLGCP